MLWRNEPDTRFCGSKYAHASRVFRTALRDANGDPQRFVSILNSNMIRAELFESNDQWAVVEAQFQWNEEAAYCNPYYDGAWDSHWSNGKSALVLILFKEEGDLVGIRKVMTDMFAHWMSFPVHVISVPDLPEAEVPFYTLRSDFKEFFPTPMDGRPRMTDTRVQGDLDTAIQALRTSEDWGPCETDPVLHFMDT